MKRSNGGRQVNETTPLTQAEEHDDVEDKIPWLQLFILCYARISDGWLFWTILPYVAQMVEDTGVAHDKIGFYSGLIESVYSVTEFLSMQFIWRHASDKYGRKPILILTMTGISASAIAFGYSKTVWQMLLSRAICGCFAGSIATIRIMFSEISTEKTRGTVFSYFAFTGSLSGLLSPLVGGLLARPADRFAYFRDWQSLIKYPYLLPSLVGGALPGSTAIIAVFLLDETKPEGADYSEAALSTKELLRVPGLLNLLVLHNWMSYVSFAWITIAPVFWYTKVERGGLGLAPHDIAWLMGTIGAFRGVMNIVSNPRLHKRYGTQGVLRLSTVGFLVTILLGPLTNLVRAHFTMPIVTGFLWFTVLSVYIQSLAYFAFSIAIVDVSPSPQSLGQVVSFFLSNSVFIRAIAPATATSLYAYGVESQLASGQFAWIVLAFLAAGLCYQAFTTILYKAKKPTTPQAARHHAPRSMTSDEDA